MLAGDFQRPERQQPTSRVQIQHPERQWPKVLHIRLALARHAIVLGAQQRRVVRLGDRRRQPVIGETQLNRGTDVLL